MWSHIPAESKLDLISVHNLLKISNYSFHPFLTPLLTDYVFTYLIDRAIARRLLIMEAKAQYQGSPYEICGQSGTAQDFLRVLRFSSTNYHPTNAPFSHL
jgi:hypothetical protein